MEINNQLTYDERCQIYILKKTGNTQAEIAAAVGTSQSTIIGVMYFNTVNGRMRNDLAGCLLG